MKVLHVTECYSGGVATAIEGYAAGLDSVDQVLLFNARRVVEKRGRELSNKFLRSYPLSTQHFKAVRDVVRIVQLEKPHVIHAHSSFAGVYTRLASLHPAVRKTPIVYTPHGLSFVRQDISPAKRKAFYSLEKALAPLASILAGCSTHESELLSRLTKRTPSILVPNALSKDNPALRLKWNPTRPPTVGAIGRISNQRDPTLFIETVRIIRESHPDVHAVWIGDGSEKDRRLLESHGIEVTGWLSGEELYTAISQLMVFVHPAKWDGFPMAVIEAVTIGVPTLVSDIGSLRECPSSARFQTSEEAAAKSVKLLESMASGYDSLVSGWGEVRKTYSSQQQINALMRVYSMDADLSR